jgi:mannose/cellobiose epimerase-like protein (N-acyl-D-glucosamine 2-epimerase family)
MQTSLSAEAAGADPQTVVDRLKSLMIEHSLPLWSSTGWDDRSGMFVERLSVEGRADVAAPRRVRVQARQIYCYAKAVQMEWYPAGREIALKALERLLQTAKSPDGEPGYVHLLSSDGAVVDARRDTYDHAFVLLALATVYAITKDAQVRTEIDSALEFLDRKLRSPHGGFLNGLPAWLPRQQNPHMHLFEAMLALYEATGEAQFQNRAGDFFGLFVSNFFDQRSQTLGEFFEDDWSPINPAVVEPGHQAEWLWLLRSFERNTGCPTGRFRSALLTSALRGRDEATGCLVDECDASGRITRATRRLWPQTEIAKAYVAQAETSEPGAEDEAKRALVRLERHYLSHPVKGAWYDQFDADGKSLVDFVPASSFYHVLCAVTEAAQVLE